eukprot:303290_1
MKNLSSRFPHRALWHKKQIVFNISQLSYGDKDLTNMIMYTIVRGKVSEDISDKRNIFCKTIWKIFPNIQTIHIYTTDSSGYFEASLSEIENKWFKQITITAVQKDSEEKETSSWISLMWSSSNTLTQKYQSKNLKIYLQIENKCFKQITITAVQFNKKTELWISDSEENSDDLEEEETPNWISLIWSSSSNTLTQKYQSKNLKIYLQIENKCFKQITITAVQFNKKTELWISDSEENSDDLEEEETPNWISLIWSSSSNTLT